MSTLLEQAAEKVAAAQSIAERVKAEGRDFTAEESEEIGSIHSEVSDLRERAQKAAESQRLLADLAGGGEVHEEGAKSFDSIGEAFVRSDAFRAFRKAHPSGVSGGTPIRIEAKGLGGAADLGIGRKATITTVTGKPFPLRVPGYRSELLDEPLTFLDIVTTGSTAASWIEYAQIVSETDNAAIVPEGELKPLSDVTTAKAEAKAHTYADGFDITNQTLVDDGALALFMQSRIVRHVRGVVERVLINGDASSNVKGILNTSGVQAQAFDTDIITTLARALEKVEAVQATPQAIVMNPADAWKLSLTKESGVGYLMGNPLQQGLNPTPFGVRLIKSSKVAVGSALVGDFSSLHFLEREALQVLAFNQHKDYAQRNMTYVRAELRGLQLFYAPREVVVADLTA